MKKFREFIALVAVAFVIILLYIFLEFAFLLSKISYLSRFSLLEDFRLFLNSSLLLLIPIGLFIGFVYVAFGRQNKIINLAKQLLIFLISLLFVFLAFSHLDTFVYTSFNHLSISYHSPLSVRILIFFCLFALSFILTRTYLLFAFKVFCNKTKILTVVLSITLICGAIFLYLNIKQQNAFNIKINRQSNEKLPNIILFSSDGLETRRMSVYGANRDTTPNIREFAKSAIVFTQAYCNVQNTRGSVVSILTGKSPTTTKVFGPGEILLDRNSFEHLPGILRKMGYYCASLNFHDQQSPVVTNMLDSFDEVNGVRTYLTSENYLLKRLLGIYPLETYFLRNLFLERIYYKLACLCGVIKIFPLELFFRIEDNELIGHASRIVKEIKRPVFIQIHLASTHRSVFWAEGNIPKRFSLGNKCSEEDNDCYDDALIYIDKLFGDLLNALKQSDKYNQTIITFLTDHSRHGSYGHLTTPLPLIIRFPGVSDIHNCDYPVQYLDLAPSILEAIHVSIPTWMEGEPILYPKYNLVKEQIISRPIFTFVTWHTYNKKQHTWLRAEVRPPLYGIQEVDMVIDKYVLRLGIIPDCFSELRVLENHKHILINDNNRSNEYLSILLGYLKNKGIIVKPIHATN